MTLREMQVDGGLFQVAMSEEDLNGAQVSTVFEQVGSKTVPAMLHDG